MLYIYTQTYSLKEFTTHILTFCFNSIKLRYKLTHHSKNKIKLDQKATKYDKQTEKLNDGNPQSLTRPTSFVKKVQHINYLPLRENYFSLKAKYF